MVEAMLLEQSITMKVCTLAAVTCLHMYLFMSTSRSVCMSQAFMSNVSQLSVSRV